MRLRTLCGVGASLALVMLGLAAAAPAAPVPADLDALITYETRQVTATGVTRTETWQERLIRRGDTVWTERVLPAQAAALHANESVTEHAGHKHFDFDSAARWLQRDAKGEPQLRFVDREHRVVVSVPKAEYGAVGFDGRWDAAASVVPPEVVARMAASSPANAAGGQWRTEKAKGWSHRVLWSEAQQVALRVESKRDDGSMLRVVSVVPAKAVAASDLPWNGIGAYTQKEYDDFMD
jgi:hypothetical protein